MYEGMEEGSEMATEVFRRERKTCGRGGGRDAWSAFDGLEKCHDRACFARERKLR